MPQVSNSPSHEGLGYGEPLGNCGFAIGIGQIWPPHETDCHNLIGPALSCLTGRSCGLPFDCRVAQEVHISSPLEPTRSDCGIPQPTILQQVTVDERFLGIDTRPRDGIVGMERTIPHVSRIRLHVWTKISPEHDCMAERMPAGGSLGSDIGATTAEILVDRGNIGAIVCRRVGSGGTNSHPAPRKGATKCSAATIGAKLATVDRLSGTI